MAYAIGFAEPGSFGTVCVTVEDRKSADQRRGDPQRRTRGECDHGPEDYRRRGDADLDAGNGNAQAPKHTTKRHHQRKGDRQYPDRRRTKHGAPNAHRHHGDDVVEAEDRVLDAGDEAGPNITLPDVRDRDDGREKCQRNARCSG